MSESTTAPSSPSSTTQHSTSNYTSEQLAACREKWVAVTKGTVDEDLDILTILLDHGGFPGLLHKDGIKWERNSTGTWTYFYG